MGSTTIRKYEDEPIHSANKTASHTKEGGKERQKDTETSWLRPYDPSSLHGRCYCYHPRLLGFTGVMLDFMDTLAYRFFGIITRSGRGITQSPFQLTSGCQNNPTDTRVRIKGQGGVRGRDSWCAFRGSDQNDDILTKEGDQWHGCWSWVDETHSTIIECSCLSLAIPKYDRTRSSPSKPNQRDGNHRL